MKPTTKAVHHHLMRHAKQSDARVTGTARLTYYIFEGILAGFIGTDMVHVTAWSGGAGGNISHHRTDTSANNPYFYAKKEIDDKAKHLHVHGGPIPPGRYQIHPPGHRDKLGLCAFLQPLQTLPNQRGGFYIHGPGPHGSDGCIVIEKDAFASLMAKLTASKGGSLHVCQAMDGDFFA
jgi:hypothetical protein